MGSKQDKVSGSIWLKKPHFLPLCPKLDPDTGRCLPSSHPLIALGRLMLSLLYPPLRTLLFQFDPETAHDWTLQLLHSSPDAAPKSILRHPCSCRAASGDEPRFSQPGRAGGRIGQKWRMYQCLGSAGVWLCRDWHSDAPPPAGQSQTSNVPIAASRGAD